MRCSLSFPHSKISMVAIGCCLLFLSSLPASAFDAAQYYELKCASCHTIGGGDDVGPDLKDVHKRREEKWLIRFIQESQSMVNEGDPIAVELFEKYRRKKMPDHELSVDEVKTLLEFIKTGKAAGGNQTFKSALKATDYDINQGHKFFTGERALSKGGASCISCHSAGNTGILGAASWGPISHLAYSSYNDRGLSKVLTRISFPTMLEVYKNKPLTEDEVFQIKSYLYSIDKAGLTEEGTSKKFTFIGLIGFLLLLGVFDLMWKTRRRKTRKNL